MLSKLIACGRARAREEARACGRRRREPTAEEQVAAEAVAVFGGTRNDRRLWEGAAFALGWERFAELVYAQQSENAADGAPRDSVTAFQKKVSKALECAIKNFSKKVWPTRLFSNEHDKRGM